MIDVTRRCDYACRILRQAYYAGEGYVSVAEVAEVEDIPYAFARSIQHELVDHGFIETTRGSRGGMRLKADPTKATVLDVFDALQGGVNIAPCTADEEYCSKADSCAFHKVWLAAEKLLSDLFGAITLKELLDSGGDLPMLDCIIAGEMKCQP